MPHERKILEKGMHQPVNHIDKKEHRVRNFIQTSNRRIIGESKNFEVLAAQAT